MMRPLFGKRISVVSTYDLANPRLPFEIFPNPTRGSIYVRFENSTGKSFTYQVFDCLGAGVLSGTVKDSEVIEIAKLRAGIYFFRLFNPEDNTWGVRKLVVR
jgi:hypothetical protein